MALNYEAKVCACHLRLQQNTLQVIELDSGPSRSS
jgi:hypothetical protein